ncbi:MAG: 4Fe-4S binding protein, partial [Bacteroidetes bacterium]|nr:4Fe-4S binding protein [Bacteroidota bacterium]
FEREGLFGKAIEEYTQAILIDPKSAAAYFGRGWAHSSPQRHEDAIRNFTLAIDLNPEFVPTSEPGERAGLGTYHYENIEIIGAEVESLVDKDFEVIRKPPVSAGSGRLRTFIKNRICPRPTIDKTICTNCGTCVEMCPVNPKAVNWHTGDESAPPTFKYGHCIRCYCCQESCPEGAITVKDRLLSKVFFR